MTPHRASPSLSTVAAASVLAALLAACGGSTASSSGASTRTEAPGGADAPVAGDQNVTAEDAEPSAIGREAEPVSSSDAPADPLGLPNERAPREGLRTGGQPDEQTIATAAERGYTTVVSLRTEGEPGTEGERATVEEHGMTFVSIPVAGADGLTEENARALSEALEQAEGPTVLHCGSGNRVGSLLALEAYFVDGKGVDEAMALGRASGMTGLEDSVREILTESCEQDPERPC